jgi:hypothetical protein
MCPEIFHKNVMKLLGGYMKDNGFNALLNGKNTKLQLSPIFAAR